MPVTPASGKWRQENVESKVIFRYTRSSSATQPTSVSVASIFDCFCLTYVGSA